MMAQKILPSLPFRVEFEVVSGCNLNCTYCYAQPFTHITPPLERLKNLFEKTKEEANPFEILLIGGEPFSRRDIVDVFELAKNTFKTVVEVSTNGTLINRLTKEELMRLKNAVGNDAAIQVSLDSVRSEINDRTRGKTAETLDGLDILERNEIPFTVGIVITKANQDDVLNSTEVLMKKYSQMKLLNLEPLQPAVDPNKYQDLVVDRHEMYDLMLRVEDMRSQLDRENVKVVEVIERCTDRVEETLLDSYHFKTCTAGVIQAGVLVNGDVTPCLNLREVVLGNAYNEPWSTIWKRSIERFKSLDIEVEQCQCRAAKVNM